MPPEETILSAAPAAPDTGIVQSQTVEPPAAAAPASAPAVAAAPAVPLTFDKVIGPDGTTGAICCRKPFAGKRALTQSRI